MSEEEIIDKVMMIDQWKVSGDIYTQNELNAIGELLELYNKEKEKNKNLQDKCIELEEENIKIKHLMRNPCDIPRQIIIEKMNKDINTNEHTILGGRRNGKTLEYGIRLGRIQMCEELLEEGDDK